MGRMRQRAGNAEGGISLLRLSSNRAILKPVSKGSQYITQSHKALTNERKHDVFQGFHDARSRLYGMSSTTQYGRANDTILADLINEANKSAR